MEFLKSVVSKYGCTSNDGWTPTTPAGDTILSKRNGKEVVKVKILPKGKYIISDMIGNKLLSGNKNIETGVEKVITQYFFGKEI